MTRTLMIVDDDWAFRITLQEILKQEGWDVVSAEDGAQAIQMVTDSRIDLIFMDIHLAGTNGIDTHAEIKEISPDCVVVMMTGYSREALVEQALSQGALAVLQKPVQIERLMEIANNVAYALSS